MKHRALAVSIGVVVLAVLASLVWLGLVGAPRSGGTPGSPAADPPAIAILAWNDLGMHCYNPGFADIAVLPPYNNLFAQIVQRGGEDPRIVTSGLTVTYSFPANTYSALQPPNPARSNKTDFWSFVQPLFGVNPPVNVGLTGNGLSGTMKVVGDHFEATGIPLTEYNDTDAIPGRNPSTWTRHPYQLATIVVKNSAGTELGRQQVVAPVSTEMDCGTCHSDAGSATTTPPAIKPTGNVGQNILAKHDAMNPGVGPLLPNRPVFCDKCHSSNALNFPGQPGEQSLSRAMHSRHSNVTAITPNAAGCYNCHPGPVTKCMRDVMTVKGEVKDCITCHGTMAVVATNPNPWLNEPRCDNPQCHGTKRPDIRLNQPLYRNSRGHQNIYCAACHDSPHALAPSREPNDGLKFIALQGTSGFISKCTVCHTTKPNERFSHSPGD